MKQSIVLASVGAIFLAVPVFGQSLSERYGQVQAQRVNAQRDNSSKASMLGTLLYQDISVTFQDTAVRDAINFIANTLGINIIGRYNDDRTAQRH